MNGTTTSGTEKPKKPGWYFDSPDDQFPTIYDPEGDTEGYYKYWGTTKSGE